MEKSINPFEILETKLDNILLALSEQHRLREKQETLEADSEIFIDKDRVKEILGVSHVTIWDWEKRGILQSYRIGNLKRFKLSEIMAAPKPINRSGPRLRI